MDVHGIAISLLLKVDENTGIGFYTQACGKYGSNNNFIELHAGLVMKKDEEWIVKDFAIKRVENVVFPTFDNGYILEDLEMVRTGVAKDGKIYLLYGIPEFNKEKNSALIPLRLMVIEKKDEDLKITNDITLDNVGGYVVSEPFLTEEGTLKFVGCYMNANTTTINILEVIPDTGEIKRKIKLPEQIKNNNYCFCKYDNCDYNPWSRCALPCNSSSNFIDLISIISMADRFFIPVYVAGEVYLLDENGEVFMNVSDPWEIDRNEVSFANSKKYIWAFEIETGERAYVHVWNGSSWTELKRVPISPYGGGFIVDEMRNEVLAQSADIEHEPDIMKVINITGDVVKNIKEKEDPYSYPMWIFLDNSNWIISMAFHSCHPTEDHYTHWADCGPSGISFGRYNYDESILEWKKFVSFSQSSPTHCPWSPYNLQPQEK